jgi:hypothetical protein
MLKQFIKGAMLNKYNLVIIIAVTEREKWALAGFFRFGDDL